MRFVWTGWLCVSLLLLSGAVCAAAPADVPVQTSLLVDEAGVLTQEEHGALLARLLSIQHSGRAQIAVLISSGTGDAPLSDYALRVAESWELGRARRDDGLLILIVPSINGARLEVGYGLEGAIPDARASQWIDELLPAIRAKEVAKGLERLLEQIDAVLPLAPDAAPEKHLFEEHPEWAGPFVLVIFSLFALFPLFFGRWGGIPSAFLAAAFYGGAAWMFWNSTTAGAIAAAVAFPLPLLWALNHEDDEFLPAWLRYAKAFGNLVAVAMFFTIITLFVGVGLTLADAPAWPGAFFSGLLTAALAVFLFPGKIADYLMVVLRSAVQFTFILAVAFVALVPFVPDPAPIAAAIAGAVTALVALGLYLDSREGPGRVAAGGRRWSLWLYGLAVLIALPFGVVALIIAIGGEDLQTQILQGAAGGGSIAGILALAARYGLFAALKVGLGGRFGGGGAGRSD